MTGYSEDLAYIHDAGFGDVARHAAGVLLPALRARGIGSGLVVDLGCGSGILARELSDAGYDVLGVDISPGMIRMARRRAPRARFVTASLLRFELPRCAALVSVGECINYMFDPSSSQAAVTRLFRRVCAALAPGGVFLFDFAEPGQIRGSDRAQKHVLAPDWAVLVNHTEDRRRGVLTRRIVSFRKTGKLYRRTEETHTVRLYPAAAMLRALRRMGFRARVMRSYGTLLLRPAHAAILATRP